MSNAYIPGNTKKKETIQKQNKTKEQSHLAQSYMNTFTFQITLEKNLENLQFCLFP